MSTEELRAFSVDSNFQVFSASVRPRHRREQSTLRRTLGVPVLLDGPPMKWPGVVSGSEKQIAESLRTIAGDRIDEIQLILFPTNPTVQMIGRVLETATNH